MFFTAAVGVLASFKVGGIVVVWGILAVLLPARSTALSAYNGLYAFERHMKVYQDAANSLHLVHADSPELTSELSDDEYREALDEYVQKAEDILRREQGQWGQLPAEVKVKESEAPAESRRQADCTCSAYKQFPVSYTPPHVRR